MDDDLISYEQAAGLPPLAPSSSDANTADDGMTSVPVPSPSTVSNGAGSSLSTVPPDLPDSAYRPLTVRPGTPPKSDGLISYEDATAPSTPYPNTPFANTADDSWLSGATKGLGTAAVKAVGNIGGFAGGLQDLTDYLVSRAESKITGKPIEQVEADYARKKAMVSPWVQATDPANLKPADISQPILAKTGEYQPMTGLGKAAQAGAEAVMSSVGPGMGSAAAPLKTIAKGVGTMAVPNAVAGGVGQTASDYLNDPLWGMAAGLAAGAGTHGAGSVAKPFMMGVPGTSKIPVVGPAIQNMRDNAAAQKLFAKSSDPAALRDWAQNPDFASDVEGSPRTLAGTIGNDPGLFQAEKAARQAFEKNNPDSGNTPFNALDRQQSAAQQAAIQNVQPDGDVFRPGQVIRDRLNAIDAASQAAEDRLTAAHNDAVSGRTQATQDYAAGLQNQADDNHARLVQAFQDRQSQLDLAARLHAAGIGEPVPLEEVGAHLRNALAESDDAANAHRGAIHDAVDPDGTLAVVATPVKDAKQRLAASIDRFTGVEPSGAEGALWSDIDRLPDVIPYRSLQTLDNRVTAAMADARRNPNPNDPMAKGRLVQLKSAVMSAIYDAADHQAAHQARLVKAGLMKPEETMEAQINALRDKWKLESRVGADASRTVARTGTGAPVVSGDGAYGGSRSFGARSEAFGGSGTLASDQGISAPSLEPNFDQAAAERVAAAKKVGADYKQTFGNKFIAPMLEDNGFRGQYTFPNGKLVPQVFPKGPVGFEATSAYLKAIDNSPAGIAALQDAALDRLRTTGIMPMGEISPTALAKWKADYGPALRAIDKAVPGFSRQFDDAASATQTALDHGVMAKEVTAQAQKDAAANVAQALKERTAADKAQNTASRANLKSDLGQIKQQVAQLKDQAGENFYKQAGTRIAPEEVENTVGSMLKTGKSGATNMRTLVQAVSSDPDALAGLRRAGVDWTIGELKNSDGSLSGGKFIDFVRDNQSTLRELYGEEGLRPFNLVARDVEENARWRTKTATKGGSDSLANFHASDFGEKAKSIGAHTSVLFALFEGLKTGFEHGGFEGAAKVGAAATAAYLLNGLRSAGIRSVNDLYRTALLNPKAAAYLVSKMPETPNASVRALIGLLRRETLMAPLVLPTPKNTNGQMPRRATGGRVEANLSPSEAQKQVGNYKKGHMRVHGLDVTIENQKGSFRSGTDQNGKPWRVRLQHHYGYIRGTIGADGDHVDAYIGPDESSDKVFVIDQKHLGTNKFDEHKVMLGFKNREAALGGHNAGFSDGKGHTRMMKITPMSIPEFKEWLTSGQTHKPFAAQERTLAHAAH